MLNAGSVGSWDPYLVSYFLCTKSLLQEIEIRFDHHVKLGYVLGQYGAKWDLHNNFICVLVWGIYLKSSWVGNETCKRTYLHDIPIMRLFLVRYAKNTQ
jgi:hypothetical protein